MRTLALAAALAAASALAMPAWAQSNGQQGTSGTETQGTTENHTGAMSGHQHMNRMHVARQIREDLTKAGFTDIHMMPESFLVRAKNSEGMPVMMVINPDSVTAVTAMAPSSGAPGSGSHGTVGSNSGNGHGTVGSNGAGTTTKQ